MTPERPHMNTQAPLSDTDKSAKGNALIAYICMSVGLFTLIFAFIGVIWASVKKSDAAGSVFEDHFHNITSTFWWALIGSVVCFFLEFLLIGYLLLPLVWLWVLYRVVKGIARLTSNRAYQT